ncbi:hypothetical protein F4553_004631 [Allocatelliglobosispora scoriae]|uniref:AbiEi antitoxin C-terminal domain-containing protein n=1 Tax=Allocatelliglobosispora scoriae TaxID=643052 RepID=A0A841BWV9_9ACTN|nr:type IV toxin-antitoxin system AbiEi family antitoxin [Allocatelliglobosispora scoriae]MBB5871252.1 hypothetical protein [Allocatelliglobosispora scoriae]
MPSSLAPLLRDLEIDRPEIVTIEDLDRRRRQLGISLQPGEIARRLRRLGWLLPLRVRGAWEFAPADRGAAIAVGDPFIEVRALAAVRSETFVGIGFESAAFLRGFAAKPPAREVIVLDEGAAVIRALSMFRLVRLTLPREAFDPLRGLPVQTADGLISSISIRPDGFHNWAGLSVWLPTIATQVDTATQSRLLAGRNASAWSRAAYLLGRGGNDVVADRLLARRPPGRGPFYLGPRTNRGRYDAATQVVDTVGLIRHPAIVDEGPVPTAETAESDERTVAPGEGTRPGKPTTDESGVPG